MDVSRLSQELIDTSFVARQGNMISDRCMLHCDNLDAGRVRHITASRIVRSTLVDAAYLGTHSLTYCHQFSLTSRSTMLSQSEKVNSRQMANKSFPNQRDTGAHSGRPRLSWSDSFSSASNIAFKMRRVISASQRKTRSLNSRTLQQKHQQNAVPYSKLLTLPLEIRLMVYDYVFTSLDTTYSDIRLTSSRNIYLNPLRKSRLPFEYRITGHPCMGEEAFSESGKARLGLATRNAEDIANLKRNEDANTQYRESKLGVMALMLTCRALYHEVLGIFYAHRTWQFNDLDTLIVAAERIPVRHFNNIRSLYLNTKCLSHYTDFTGYMWDLPSSYQQRFTHLAPPPKSLLSRVLRNVDTGDVRAWQAVCDTIAGMESLKRLRIHLCEEAFIAVLAFRRPHVHITAESFVFASLAAIAKRRNLEVFEVQVDWPVGDDDAWAEEAERDFALIRLAEGSHLG